MKIEPFVYRDESPELLLLESWMERFPWLVAGFSTKKGGASKGDFSSLNCGLHVGDHPEDVVANRTHIAQLLSFDFEAWTCADQIHSANITEVTERDRGKGRDSLETTIKATDALYTTQPNLLLASFYADCVPLFFLDPAKKLIGVAHAGWKGTVAQIGVKLIEQWKNSFGSKVEDIRVSVGPSIGGCCYEVDEAVMSHVRPFSKDLSSETYRSSGEGKYHLDLKRINVDFILQAGISPSHIEVSKWCTSCDHALFFSHRKDKGSTGRMAAFIAMKED